MTEANKTKLRLHKTKRDAAYNIQMAAVSNLSAKVWRETVGNLHFTLTSVAFLIDDAIRRDL
jgi:hypothetical protein